MADADVKVTLGSSRPSGASLVLKPGANLVTGETAFARYFSAPTTLEADVLRVAAAIYATDIGTLRGDRETYSRLLRVQVPVINLPAFNAVKEKLTYCLSLLSADTWRIEFKRAQGAPEGELDWPDDDGDVLLFSGGLDSLAQAVARAQSGSPTALVSHDSGNKVTAGAQDALLKHIHGLASVDAFPQYVFRVRGQSHEDWPYTTDREPSQRTRSFLFLALGALVARRRGAKRILFMAENGQMAIHLPLTAARVGAFSTRTAHPEALAVAAELFSEVLEFEVSIENPYLYRTKAEVVEHLSSASHLLAVRRSVSCWKGSRVEGQANHCGACVPCIVRRIALEHWGSKKGTDWARDLFAEDVAALAPDDDGKRNLMEVVDLALRFEDTKADVDLCLEYPELINRHFKLKDTIAMYRRFAGEARNVLGNYPKVRPLL